jgi:hypothetical protein
MTVYNSRNVARNTRVYDVDTKQEVRQVLSIDTDHNVVECAHDPLEVTASGDIATFEATFRAIHAIRGTDALPSLFHCYGRVGT